MTPLPFSMEVAQMIVSSGGEPSCEDTEQELRERVFRSALSAVDVDQIKRIFPVVGLFYIQENQIPGPNSLVRTLR
jgi:hypothetical protein